MKENYTKGDCYALCEFLENLLCHRERVIRDVAVELGYPQDSMINLLRRLDDDVDAIICDEQEQQDYTEQMAEIMELKHIKGGRKCLS